MRKLIKFLSSLYLGLVLLGMIAVASVYGSILASEAEQGIFIATSRVFNAWWYIALLGLLSINIILCFLHRGRQNIELLLKRPIKRDKEFFIHQRNKVEVPYSDRPEAVSEALKRFSTRSYQRGNFYYGQRGIVAPLGRVVLHLGLLIILLSGLWRFVAYQAGAIVHDGRLILGEGEKVDYFYTWDRRDRPFSTENLRSAPLDFQITCLDFNVEKFPGSEIPRRFSTLLKIEDKDRETIALIEMNKPFKYERYKFHQVDRQESPETLRAMVRIDDLISSKVLAQLDLTPGQPQPIPGTANYIKITGLSPGSRWEIFELEEASRIEGLLELPLSEESFVITRLVPDFRLDRQGEVFSASAEFNNPAIYIAYYRQDKTYDGSWHFHRAEFRQFSPSHHPLVDFHFLAYSPVENATGQAISNYKVEIAAMDKLTEKVIKRQWVRIGEMFKLVEDEQVIDQSRKIGFSTLFRHNRYRVKFLYLTPGYTTILGVQRDPTFNLTYLGTLLLISGALGAFFVRHRQLWAYLDRETQRVYLIYRSRPQTDGAKRELNRIVKALQGT